MRSLVVVFAILCAPCTADAATNFLKGCRNCNLRTVSKAKLVAAPAKTVAKAEAQIAERPAPAKRLCANGVCRLRGQAIRSRTVERRAWFPRMRRSVAVSRISR